MMSVIQSWPSAPAERWCRTSRTFAGRRYCSGPMARFRSRRSHDAIGRDVSGCDFAEARRRRTPPPGTIFVSGATLVPIVRERHLAVANWLHRVVGQFIISASDPLRTFAPDFRIVQAFDLATTRKRCGFLEIRTERHALLAGKPRLASSACPSSSARIGTPRLQACTPWTTQSFSTSMISSIVAPALSAPLM